METGSLVNVMKTFGPMKEPILKNCVIQVLKGLMYLHKQGVIHRDIKGANILTDKEWFIYFSFFYLIVFLYNLPHFFFLLKAY
jgi:serine/threonine protein kinase